MADSRHTPPHAATESIGNDAERHLDDLEDLDDLDDEDEFESLDDLGMLDELERWGGFSESTSPDDPPDE